MASHRAQVRTAKPSAGCVPTALRCYHIEAGAIGQRSFHRLHWGNEEDARPDEGKDIANLAALNRPGGSSAPSVVF